MCNPLILCFWVILYFWDLNNLEHWPCSYLLLDASSTYLHSFELCCMFYKNLTNHCYPVQWNPWALPYYLGCCDWCEGMCWVVRFRALDACPGWGYTKWFVAPVWCTVVLIHDRVTCAKIICLVSSLWFTTFTFASTYVTVVMSCGAAFFFALLLYSNPVTQAQMLLVFMFLPTVLCHVPFLS